MLQTTQALPQIKTVREHRKYNWVVIVAIGLLHAGALLAPFTFSWSAFWVFFALYWITGGLGVTLCYHRLLTHRSFQCPKILEYILTFFAYLALQGGPITWVANHRCHHVNSDTDEDPHNARRGFLWSHMLWLFIYNPVTQSKEFPSRFAPDLVKDPFHRWMNRFGFSGVVLLGILLYAWGGWPFVIWGIFVRTVFVYHLTWLVNSATHMWGYKSFPTEDNSRNLWWVGIFGFGEGWHNNHHAFQQSARHGLRWWELDATYLTIKILALFKLATSVKIPKLAFAKSQV